MKRPLTLTSRRSIFVCCFLGLSIAKLGDSHAYSDEVEGPLNVVFQAEKAGKFVDRKGLLANENDEVAQCRLDVFIETENGLK